MSNTPEAVTFASLRARTDRELVALIEAALERGLLLLCQHPNGDGEKAEQAHDEAVKLLSLVYEFSGSDRRRLDTKLAELRSALDADMADCKHFPQGVDSGKRRSTLEWRHPE